MYVTTKGMNNSLLDNDDVFRGNMYWSGILFIGGNLQMELLTHRKNMHFWHINAQPQRIKKWINHQSQPLHNKNMSYRLTILTFADK